MEWSDGSMTFRLISPQPCPIWGTGAEIRSLDPLWYWYDSPRAGGVYVINKQAEGELPKISNEVKARLTTILVDKRKMGEMPPHVTLELLDHANVKEPLPPYERADRLLGDLVACPHKVGEPLPIVFDDRTLAVTESTEFSEVQYFLRYLKEMEWVRIYDNNEIEITVNGYTKVQQQITNHDSSQAFVAMWLGGDAEEKAAYEKVEAAYEKGIVPAIRDAGYREFRIDKDPKVQKIDDAIIAGIRRSRFMVADFTYGRAGIRGSVYYEAGFAQGLGIPVVYSCWKDQINDLHFDTEHYHHIAWGKPEDLREGLTKRILAIVGEGPHIARTL